VCVCVQVRDSYTGQSGLQTSSLIGQGHCDLENNTLRRRHVTGEGHNGDSVLPATGSDARTGKLLDIASDAHTGELLDIASDARTGELLDIASDALGHLIEKITLELTLFLTPDLTLELTSQIKPNYVN